MVLCQKGEEQDSDNGNPLFVLHFIFHMEKRRRDGVLYDSVTPSSA